MSIGNWLLCKTAKELNTTYDSPTHTDCLLKTAIKKYGGGDNRWQCGGRNGHIFCYCEWCSKYPTCLRCRLFMNTGNYL